MWEEEGNIRARDTNPIASFTWPRKRTPSFSFVIPFPFSSLSLSSSLFPHYLSLPPTLPRSQSRERKTCVCVFGSQNSFPRYVSESGVVTYLICPVLGKIYCRIMILALIKYDYKIRYIFHYFCFFSINLYFHFFVSNIFYLIRKRQLLLYFTCSHQGSILYIII